MDIPEHKASVFHRISGSWCEPDYVSRCLPSHWPGMNSFLFGKYRSIQYRSLADSYGSLSKTLCQDYKRSSTICYRNTYYLPVKFLNPYKKTCHNTSHMLYHFLLMAKEHNQVL